MNKKIEHFYCLDLLRGISSVAILVWHYSHFWCPDFGDQFSFDRKVQPLYSVLWPIYEHGYVAVQLFWLISGFVFAHIYAGSAITAGEFALRRFARLYPLHFITLIVVAALQLISLFVTSKTQVVGNVDFYHFIASLFLYSPLWGWDWSFNIPIWSVTIEEVIYAAFFIVCPFIFSRRSVIPIALAVGSLFVAMTSAKLMLFAICGFYFFVGVWTYFASMNAKDRPAEVLGGAIALTVATLSILKVPDALGDPQSFIKPIGLFVPMIVACAVIDLQGWQSQFLHNVRWLGDATYSMYLWHFPIQIALLIWLNGSGIGRAYFASPILLLSWIGLMLGVGVWSFRSVERPIQKAILKAAGQFRLHRKASGPRDSVQTIGSE